MNRAYWLSILLFLTLAPPTFPKRAGGGGFGSIGRSGGRGSSSARSGTFGGGSKSSGGGFGGGHHSGGYKPSGGSYNPSHGNIGRTSGGGGWNSGGHGTSGGWGHNTGGHSSTGWNPKHSSSGGWGSRPHTRSGLGGLFGGGGIGPRHSHRYSKGSGIGSVLRSNSFKNAVVGAAAGYLTYRAGRAIINSMTRPMMWGNRNYYWGQSYYQPSHGQNQMCRMPIESDDEKFGNVYFQDNTRPREIVWGCGWGEYCCGYECCRGGGASGYGLPAGSYPTSIHSYRNL